MPYKSFFNIPKRVLSRLTKGSYDPEQKYKTGNWREFPSKKIDGIPRVAWVLSGNEEVGSSRLKGILIDKYSHQHPSGFISSISYMPNQMNMKLLWQRHEWQPVLKRIDVLVLQTWSGSTLELLEDCQRHRISVVFTLSDLEFHRIPKNHFDLISAIVVSSEPLRENASKIHKNTYFIDDPIEVPPDCDRRCTNFGSDPELVWMGHPDNWSETEFMCGILKRPEFSSLLFRTISRHPDATHQWNLETRWNDISQSDIAVIPCKLDEWGISKSSNRLASFMALGYPVIASPIPSYQKFIDQGVNGFLARDENEWIESIRLLRDPNLRFKIGAAAKGTPELDKIRIENVTEQWANLFSSLYQK